VVFQLAYELTETDTGKSLAGVTNFIPAGPNEDTSHAILVGAAFGSERRWRLRHASARRRCSPLCSSAASPAPAWAQEAPEEEEGDRRRVVIGERLFLETRFAQYFSAHSGGDVNRPLAAGDPVVASVQTTAGSVPGPFAGQSINCRSCHFVDDLAGVPGAGNRTYADFARRSPVPARDDGEYVTARNAPALVNASLPRGGGVLLHFDGEFGSAADLVRGTLTGRNFGWLPAEHADAVAHIARVIREDDGSGALAQDAGGAYRIVLAGVDPSIPRALRLPPRLRIAVARATDEEIVDGVARLIAAYVESLVFAEDESGAFAGSPYDEFLRRNNLPRKPRPLEPVASYVTRLRMLLVALGDPVYVAARDGRFTLHDQALRLRAARARRPPHLPPPARGRAGRRQLRRLPSAAGIHRLRLPQHGRGAGGV
jgi:hypothetical protein